MLEESTKSKEVERNGVAGVYTAFTDQVITRDAAHSLALIRFARCETPSTSITYGRAIRDSELRPTATQIAKAHDEKNRRTDAVGTARQRVLHLISRN